MNNRAYKTLTEFIHNLDFYEKKWLNSPENTRSFVTMHQHVLKVFGKSKEEIIDGLLRFAALLATEPEAADENYPAINFMNGQAD